MEEPRPWLVLPDGRAARAAAVSIQGTRPAVAPGGMIGPASRKSRPPGCLILPSCRGCEEARAAAPGCLIEEQRAAAIRMPRPAASWVPAVGPAEAARIPRNRAQLVALDE